MLVINLLGAPGAGKSTCAAYLFSQLKMQNISAELVSEYAKDLVWEQRINLLDDQLYILAKQNRRLSRLRGKVDVVITDSPLLLQLYYTQKAKNTPPSLPAVIKELHDSYDNFNIFVDRVKPYHPEGRTQTEQQSDQIAVTLKQMYKDMGILYGDSCIQINGNETGYNTALNRILIELSKRREDRV